MPNKIEIVILYIVFTIVEMANKQKIIEALDIMRRQDVAEKRHFQAVAYAKAITQLRTIEGDIHSVEDVKGRPGIGEKIQKKIQEILDTGRLAAAEKAKESPRFAAYEALLQVYGIGPAKAKALIEAKIDSIATLRNEFAKNPNLLTSAQAIGLKHYEALLERIPRAEMREHEAAIFSELDKQFEAVIVGSYRRGAITSGDIDVLLTLPDSMPVIKRNLLFRKTIREMERRGYITDILALGNTKCLCVAQLPSGKARRLDLLMTPAAEMPYAILYFTGSDLFNVAFRSHALEKGYTLNEHGMEPLHDTKPKPPPMKSERDIFDFLGVTWVEPVDRKGAANVVS